MEQPSHPPDIFLPVRPRVIALLVAAALVAIAVPSLAGASTKPSKHKKKGPTAAQKAAQKLKAAVAATEHSSDLWATVNVCTFDATSDQYEVGIRGQMPSLGLPATLSMDISVAYWNGSAFAPVPGSASQLVSLGKGTHGIHQSGVNFTFTPPAAGSTYVVRGTIIFEWKVGSKVVGKVTRNTGHGYANVGFSNPPGYSAGTCTLSAPAPTTTTPTTTTP
jgi:hypothetical protein